MVAAHLRIAPLGSTTEIDPSVLRDLLYAHVAPENGVEHIRVRAGPYGADVLAFIDSADPRAAFETLRRVVNRTLVAAPPLHGWRVV